MPNDSKRLRAVSLWTAAKDLFGDSRWMPLPRPKVVSPTSIPSMYQQYAPQYVGYPGYPGYPAMGAGMWPMPEPEPDLDLSKASALKTLATAMGSRVTEDMLKDVPKATFAEASRLLLAVLGFMCEGRWFHFILFLLFRNLLVGKAMGGGNHSATET